jgi:hypothetical protein
MEGTSSPKRPWDAVVWWEARRLVFNAAVLVAGIVAVLVIAAIGSRYIHPGEDLEEPMAVLFGSVLYAIAANVAYTLGWISELLWSGGDTSRTEHLRPRVFKVGLWFSVGLTLLPALLVPLAWAVFGFQHDTP